MEIKVKAPKADNREVVVDVDIPQDLTGLVEKYGEPLVVSAVVRSLRIQVQAFIRPLIEANQSDEAIAELARTAGGESLMPGWQGLEWDLLRQAQKGSHVAHDENGIGEQLFIGDVKHGQLVSGEKLIPCEFLLKDVVEP